MGSGTPGGIAVPAEGCIYEENHTQSAHDRPRLAHPPFCSEEADMTEAPAQTMTASAHGQPAGNGAPPAAGPVSRSFASRTPTIVILTAVLLVGANPFSRPAWVSQAQITAKPTSFADVVDKVKPAVVSVRVKIDTGRRNKELARSSRDSLDRFSRRFGESDQPGSRSSSRGRSILTGQGSGFLISSDGYAVTNFHVVEKADNVEVTLDDGRVLSAKVIGADERSDVALVKVNGTGLPYVTFADAVPRIGDWVIAVGNPFGLGGTVTAGIVSARGRDIGAGPYDDFLQIDAAVNRGNSGGPTFDTDGNVVGVNTAIVSPTGGSVGIAFAIPAATVKAIVTQLRDTGKVSRGWIGVQIQEVTADLAEGLGLKGTRGALVAEPQPGAPAAKGGIETGDVIVSINGAEAHDSHDVARAISILRPGSTASIVVVRNGEEKSFNIVLGNLPDQREASVSTEAPRQKGTTVPRFGVAVAPVSEGVIVTSVDPDGPAADQGLASGDVILQAEGKKVAGASDLRNTIEAAQKAGKHAVLMRVRSGEGIKFIAVPLSRG
jgi:serine protease Do